MGEDRVAVTALPTPAHFTLYRFGAFGLTVSPRILKRSGALVALPPKAVDTLFCWSKTPEK